ncbi:gephyrin-like molybdotransferase Glp [uncultured Planktosalinus sp.]|uniref:molybdopterin molybdotransferase MoeA n=1 Tax=uncultured Planktosalinus sp. TaxID=1810935 RepID=UPI0030D8D942
MITVSEAKNHIIKHGKQPRVEEKSLSDALGFVLAETLLAKIDTPPFDNSAMDGYAFSFSNWDKKSALTVIGEVQAGSENSLKTAANEAIRIFTGAPAPKDVDTVIMQEKVERKGDKITLLDENLKQGSNIRPKGSQTKKGAVALQKNQELTPAGISYLAGMGYSKVTVYSKPKVSVIITGKELIKAGETLETGKIYESNGIGLTAALRQVGIEPVSVTQVDDVLKLIENAIKSQLSSDIIILTGGVSVGNYDLVPAALEKCGVEKIFHKVKQKPGKPLYFGKTSNALIFALPGNPAAVMTCFYEYVVEAIDSFTQKRHLKSLTLPLENDFTKKTGLTYFLKGKTTENGVKILNSQLSYMLNSFAIADCLIRLDEDKTEYKKGDLVTVLMIA